MLGNPSLGYILAAGHYLSNLLVGIIWRFRSYPSSLRNIAQSTPKVYPAQTVEIKNEVLGVGKLLGNSVTQALYNILAVGGFIVLFSVLTRMLSHWGIIDIVAALLTRLLSAWQLTYSLAYGIGIGFFEITLGAKTAVAAEAPELLATLLVLSIILAWSGLSIIAQITTILAGMPVRLSFYLGARFLQMTLAAAIVSLILYFVPPSTATVFQPSWPVYKILYSCNAWKISIYSMLTGIILILLLLLVAWRLKFRGHPANRA
jgi:nucleoside recognition membrane protein YjiH